MEGQGIIERWLRDGIQDLLDNQKRKEEIHGSLFRYPTPAVLIIEAKHEWKTTWRKNYEFCLSHVEIEATGAGVRQEVSENSVVLINISSVQFSHSVMSDSLRPPESQHTRPPCPSPTLEVYPIESVMPSNHFILCRSFSSCPQSFPASGSFQMSPLFASGGQSIGVSASASVLPMNTQDWFPLEWTGWIS